MFAWLTRFWFNEEVAFKTIYPCIVLCRVQKFCKMCLLSFHIGIKQAHISFAASPENIILSAKLNGSIQRCFNLCSCMCQYMKIGIGCGAIHIPPVRKKIGSAP